MIQKEISIDMNLANGTVLWHVQQNELNSRQLNATLTSNGSPFAISDGAFIILKWKSNNGKSGMESCTYSDGIVTTTIPSQLCLQKGVITCKYSVAEIKSLNTDSFKSAESYLEYVNNNATSVTDSAAFKLIVEPDVLGDLSSSATPEYQIFLESAAKINQLERTVYGTGWSMLSPNSGWGTTTDERQTSIRKLSGIVYMRGTVTGSNNTTNSLFTIPVEFAPPQNTYVIACDDNNNMYRCLVEGHYNNLSTVCGFKIDAILSGGQGTTNILLDTISYTL